MQINPVPDESPTLEQPPANSVSARSRAIAIAVATLILCLPIGYLVLRHRPSSSVSAQSNAPKAPGATVSQLEELVQNDPSVGNRIDLSLAYINSNQSGRAIPILDAIVANDKNNAIAWNNLCVANTMQMAYNLALEDCKNALRIAPDFQLAKNNLTWATSENKKAIAEIAAREQVAPSARDANFYLAEGLLFLHTGGYDQAIKAWQRTRELRPNDAGAANNIGLAYMLKKQPAEAIPWFGKAISIDPAMQLAKNNLAWARDEAAKARK